MFWSYYGNNNTIYIPRVSLNLLPSNSKVIMTIKGYYTVGTAPFTYVTSYSFNLMAKSSDLVEVIYYSPIFNVNSNLDVFPIDAT